VVEAFEKLRSTINNVADQDMPLQSIKDDLNELLDEAESMSGIQSATVTLDDSQVKALPGTDVELVAAPGSGKLILPLYAIFITNFAVAYSGIDANTDFPAIWVSQQTSPIYLTEFIDSDESVVDQTSLTQLLTTTNEFGRVTYTLLPQSTSYIQAPTGATLVAPSGGSFNPDEYDNLPLKIGADNSGNFTGGDPANSLQITVLYTVLDL
jgi:hypothetical protein